MRLNVGAGASRIEGYLNVDITEGADLRFDISDPWPLADASVDAIYSMHAFEHVSYRKEETLWHEVYRVLKPGGTLHVETPDVRRIMAIFLAEPEWFTFDAHNDLGCAPWGEPMRFIFGYQIGEGQVHMSAYSEIKFDSIARILGFFSYQVLPITTGNMPCLKFLATK